jgi:uncharacterized coiled-coil protein SlyX
VNVPNGTPPPQVVIPGAGWVDVASRAITQVGFPVVIAGVLLWFVLGKFQGNMELITDRMSKNTEAATLLIKELQAQTGEMKGQTEELKAQTGYMRTIATRIRQIQEKQAESQARQPPPAGGGASVNQP